ncbi:MAG TPA: preprotein translocase subunit SecE [Actinophytocola sp.]|uniref:preprotein translocase subunit SecE n=1 Tax=Actinophytocola sp. TaxID=1872138 RepID=UPI002DDD991B|nr:preprotein translocase subunit SecE [Actinophytocola sp.]HEV2779763.1 preprotein translocase subunit SecE [Actinophytocola sp.]
MADNTERENGQERPSRPVTAASRRERRATARPAARKDPVETAETTKASPKGKTGPDAKGKVRRAAKPEPAEKAADAKGRPTRARDDSKVARQGLFARIFRFLREVVAELRKVIWPTRKQMITYTAVVLVFLAIMVALIAGMDFGLAKGVLWVFG